MTVHIRPAAPSDAEQCGRIIYEAFQDIAARHGVAPDFPAVDAGIQLAQSFIAHPKIFGAVAEEDGRLLGSNFLLSVMRSAQSDRSLLTPKLKVSVLDGA